MNVKDSLAASKTSSGGALQTFRAGLCQGRASRPAGLLGPASAASRAGHTVTRMLAPSAAASRPSSSQRGWAAHRRGDARQPSGDTSQARLARRHGVEMPQPSVCSQSSNPARPWPGWRQAAPALLLQSKVFTYSSAFLQQLESRLKYRKHDIICLLPAQDRLAPL